jgi:hypothetical protein
LSSKVFRRSENYRTGMSVDSIVLDNKQTYFGLLLFVEHVDFGYFTFLKRGQSLYRNDRIEH